MAWHLKSSHLSGFGASSTSSRTSPMRGSQNMRPAGEKRFSVAAFRPDFISAQPVALLREHGRAVAFATVMTTDLADEATVGLMRFRPDTASDYAMEYLFV